MAVATNRQYEFLLRLTLIVADFGILEKPQLQSEKGLGLAELLVANLLCGFVGMSHCRWTW